MSCALCLGPGRGDARRRSELLEACSQHTGNQGKRPRTVTSNGQNRPGRGSMPRSSPSWASMSSGGNDEPLNMVARLSLRQGSIGIGQELLVLPPVRPRKHHAQHVGQGQGLECPQTKWRRICPTEVDSFPALLPGVGTKSSQVELGGKRRRLDSEPQEQRNPYRRVEVGLPVVGSSGSDVEAQQDSTFDLGGSQDVAGKDCPPGATTRGHPQVLGPQTDQQENLPQDAAFAIPWRLHLSLRLTEATEFFQHLQKLSGCGITQLILFRVRQANLHRSTLANAISQRLKR